MNHSSPLKFLFVINPGAGAGGTDWSSQIDLFFSSQPHQTEKFVLARHCNINMIREKITQYKPDRVIAVGGDGTVKLVAECLLNTGMVMGILPAGSANGLARELGVPIDIKGSLQHLLLMHTRRIHLVKINGHLCIHLSDLGFNAALVKIFHANKIRGMWGYVKAAWRVLWKHRIMTADLHIDNRIIRREAAMIVIANATKYGSGALINPEGKLDDHLFEVVIVRKVSFTELFKMMFTHRPFDKNKTELYQVQSVQVYARKKVHFQIDGEYLGRVNKLYAEILPEAVQVITTPTPTLPSPPPKGESGS